MRFIDYLNILLKKFSIRDAIQLCIIPRLGNRFGIKADLYTPRLLKFQRELITDIIEKYRNITIDYKKIPKNYKIWTLWWQGKDAMPDVIQECHKSLARNSRGHEVILIDKDNYKNYINLPEWIVTKMNEGKISLSHFSDIIRLYLLCEYGGWWVDSALFFVKPLELTQPLFMPAFYPSGGICQGKWWFGCMAGPAGFKLFEFMKECLLRYWSKYDAAVDYLMWDGFMRIAYEEFPDIKELIDCLPVCAPQLHVSRYTFMAAANIEMFAEIMRRNPVFSLTWRLPYNKNEHGEQTYYGLIIDYAAYIEKNPNSTLDEYIKHISVDNHNHEYAERLKMLTDEEFSSLFDKINRRFINTFI